MCLAAMGAGSVRSRAPGSATVPVRYLQAVAVLMPNPVSTATSSANVPPDRAGQDEQGLHRG
jgi:hypothetical protein